MSELLGLSCADLHTPLQTAAFRFPSASACMEYFRTWCGPTQAAFGALDDNGRADLAVDLTEVFEKHNVATDGTLAMNVAYLEVVTARFWPDCPHGQLLAGLSRCAAAVGDADPAPPPQIASMIERID